MDEQLALRLGALRLARRRGRVREAAWAAARLRLPGVTLATAEARFARDARIRFGRALRGARVRLARSPVLSVPIVLLPEAVKRSGPRRAAAGLVAAAVLLGALLMYVRLAGPEGAPEGARQSVQAVVATPPPPLRGRSQPGAAAPVAVVQETPAPTETPAEAPAAAVVPGTGNAGSGPGAGGAGNGTGIGTGRGTPAPTRAPTPTPAPPTPVPTPTPTIDPMSVMHVEGKVMDSVTRVGIPGVCVASGTQTCAGAILTDANGDYAVDLTIGRILNWSLTFISPGYRSASVTLRGRPGTVIQNIFLRKGP